MIGTLIRKYWADLALVIISVIAYVGLLHTPLWLPLFAIFLGRPLHFIINSKPDSIIGRHLPLTIANQFIRQYGHHGIDHFKLQKLVYFTQGWWLLLKNAPLFDERPVLYASGPEFKSLHRVFFFNRKRNITKPKEKSFLVFLVSGAPTSVSNSESADIAKLIEWILSEYGNLTSAQFTELLEWQHIVLDYIFEVPLGFEVTESEDWRYFHSLASRR